MIKHICSIDDSFENGLQLSWMKLVNVVCGRVYNGLPELLKTYLFFKGVPASGNRIVSSSGDKVQNLSSLIFCLDLSVVCQGNIDRRSRARCFISLLFVLNLDKLFCAYRY